MSTLTTHPSTIRPTIAAAAGVAGAVGAAGYISTIVLLSDLSAREAIRSPLTVTSNLVVAVAFAVLAATLPSLVTSARLPRWAGVLGAVGCAFVTANAWGTATLAVHASGLLTDQQFEQTSGWFTMFQAGQTLPCAVGFLALAVTGWRRRALPRGACLLLGAAGLLNLLPAYPPAAVLAGLALTWLARSSPHTSAQPVQSQPATTAA